MPLHKRLIQFCVALALSVALAGCFARGETMGLEIVGYNHTDHSIGEFYVNDKGGFFLGKHEGGGGFICCVSVPLKYKSGMTVSITWTDNAGENPRTREVPVPPYGPNDGGMFAVHFLRNGEIKVFVTMMGLRHPNYPLQGEEAKL